MRLICISLLLLLSVGVGAAPVLVVPDTVSPGDSCAIYLLADLPVGNVTAVVLASGAIIGRTEAHRYDHVETGEVYAALLGIPSTLEARDVVIRLTYDLDGVPVRLDRTIGVSARSFLSERIALSDAMTELSKSDSDRITAEAEALWEVLLTSRSESEYHAGRFTAPLQTLFHTAYFADRRIYSYADGSSRRSIHNGVDYRGAVGTPVYAPGAGRVVFSGARIITGNSVILEHLPGVYSLYYHLDSTRVQNGAEIRAGEIIGTVGSTGLVTGPHLHWELRVAGVAVDPEYFLMRPLLDKLELLTHIAR